jgi:hypothetical protein
MLGTIKPESKLSPSLNNEQTSRTRCHRQSCVEVNAERSKRTLSLIKRSGIFVVDVARESWGTTVDLCSAKHQSCQVYNYVMYIL